MITKLINQLPQIKRGGLLLIAGLSILGMFAPLTVHAAGPSYFPAQFIAKQYSETLGRLPDQASWQSMTSHFLTNGCNNIILRDYSKAFLISGEFQSLGYSKAAQILVLYRATLNREPDQAGYNNWLNYYNGGGSWTDIVGSFVNSSEFNGLASKICAGSSGSGTSYYWGTTPAPTVPNSGTATNINNFAGSQSQLQALLNQAAATGGTVSLAQRAVVRINSRLTIPAGVTLTTNGTPTSNRYAEMGRLVRGTTPFNDQMIWIGGGAKLQNVWVDGSRGVPQNFHGSRSSVRILGGTNTSVSNNKFSNSAGPSNVLALGSFDGWPCSNLKLVGNVITAYSSDNKLSGAWTDGLTVTCEQTDIQYNQIVDTTDVAIVLFRACKATMTPGLPPEETIPQTSIAQNNTILSAGNSMYGGLGFDALISEPGYVQQTCSFKGASINDNIMWTSPNTHFAIGIYVGSRAWYGKLADRVHMGDGARVAHNTTGILTARVGTGIAVSGMMNATVEDSEQLHFEHPGGLTACPNVDIAASLSAGTASFAPGTTPPPGVIDVAFDGCIGE